MTNPILEHNRRVWDERVRARQRFTAPASAEEMKTPLKAIDPMGWLGGDVAGRRILCLGAGGGKHGPLLAAAGAQVTVVDLSPEMLRLDREMAAQYQLQLETLVASLDDLGALPAGVFDAVMQPVSSCYVPDIQLAYRELARVTRPGAVYISRHKQPTSLQAGLSPGPQGFVLAEAYYLSGALSPASQPGPHREGGALEFLHRWGQLLGGLCRAGFVIEEVFEPHMADASAAPGSFEYRCHYIAPYIQLRARRTDAPAPTAAGALWTPPKG